MITILDSQDARTAEQRMITFMERPCSKGWAILFLIILCLVIDGITCHADEKLVAAEETVRFMLPEKEFYDGVERGARLALKDVSMSEAEKDAMAIITVAHVRDNGTLTKMRRDLADFLADKFSLEEIKQLKELYTTPLMKRIQSEVAPKVVELSAKYAK